MAGHDTCVGLHALSHKRNTFHTRDTRVAFLYLSFSPTLCLFPFIDSSSLPTSARESNSSKTLMRNSRYHTPRVILPTIGFYFTQSMLTCLFAVLLEFSSQQQQYYPHFFILFFISIITIFFN